MTLPNGGEQLQTKQEQLQTTQSPDTQLRNPNLLKPFAASLNLSAQHLQQLDQAISTSQANKEDLTLKVPKILALLTRPEHQQHLQQNNINTDTLVKDLTIIVDKKRYIKTSTPGQIVSALLEIKPSTENQIPQNSEQALNILEQQKSEKILERKNNNLEKQIKINEILAKVKAKNEELKAGPLGQQFEAQEGQMNMPKGFEQKFDAAKEKAGLQSLTLEDYRFSVFVQEQAKSNPDIKVDQSYLDNVQSINDALNLETPILIPQAKKASAVETISTTPATLDNIGQKDVYANKMENYSVAVEDMSKDLHLDDKKINEQIPNQTELLGLFALPSTLTGSSMSNFESRFKDSLTSEEIKQVEQWSVALTYLKTPQDQIAQTIQPVDEKFLGWRNQLEQNGQLATIKGQLEGQLISMAKKVVSQTCDLQEKPMEIYMDYLAGLFKKQGDKYQIDSMHYKPDGSMVFDVHTKNLEGRYSEQADAQITIKDGSMKWKSIGMDPSAPGSSMQLMEEEVSNNIATLDSMKISPNLKPILENANTYEEPVQALKNLYAKEYESSATTMLNTTKNTGFIESALNYHTTKNYFTKGMTDLITQGLYGQVPGENKQLGWKDDIKKGLQLNSTQSIEGSRLDLGNYPEQANALRVVFNTTENSTTSDMENMLGKFQNSIMNFRKKGYSNDDLKKSPEPLISELFTSEQAEKPETMSKLINTMIYSDHAGSSRDASISMGALSTISTLLDNYSPERPDYTIASIAPDFLSRPGTNIKAFEKLYEQKSTNGLDPDSYYESVFNQLPDASADLAYKSSMSKFEKGKQAVSA